ncbi:helix-hairpin-helix domain-containing protein [Halomicrococcus sp. SG-WS-1]|uniref:helix-hairpin-helix domain-containing protein n=1 Tax=Halomicrococcus sp. SG-WS-1 TaxID=3439057 RepID=UPI003F7A20DD
MYCFIMGLITRLKSLLGLEEEDRSQMSSHESGVTIEREPGEASEQPDAATERAVKTTEEPESAGEPEREGMETDETESDDESAVTGVSTEDVAVEGEATEHIEEAESEAEKPESAAEPAEATGPTTDAAQPEQTEATEPEPTPTEEQEEREAEEPDVEERPLEDVKGIGPAYAERLRRTGVENTVDLAAADPEEIADETDLSPKRIEGWIERAKSL